MSFRGLLTGVSGLKAQAKKMEVIGNNLANVNTSGYKRERVNFHDVYYQVIRHASAGDGGNVGGINSQDIGMGVQIGSIDKIFSQGSRIDSGRTFDFMIEGDDFFVSKNRATNELMLTRNGAFQLDGERYLVDSVGNKVYGFNVDPHTQAAETMATSVQIDEDPIKAEATENVQMFNNIDSSLLKKFASDTSNAWEIFSGGENFGSMNAAITGLTGSRSSYASGYYQDSVQYIDSDAILDNGGRTISINDSPANLIEGFSVGDVISVRQGATQMQREITAIDISAGKLTLEAAASSAFVVNDYVEVVNISDGYSLRGSSGTSAIHNDLLRSQIAMVDQSGQLIASFYRVSSSPSEYSRTNASISGGGTVTLGTGEFSNMSELKDLLERTLRDTQLTHYASSDNLSLDIDPYDRISFNGSGLVNNFRLVINSDNKEMIDRFEGIAITDNGITATTQARIDSSGEILASPTLGLSSRSTNESKKWYHTNGVQTYGYSSSNEATGYGEFAGLRIDGGSNGKGYGVVQLSMVNALGDTVFQEFKLQSRFADPNDNEFSNMGELASLLESALRSTQFSTVAEEGELVADLTAGVSFTNGRLQVSTSNGSFRDLKINAVNDLTDPTNGVFRSDQDYFDTVLGQLSVGLNGKRGSSNAFVQPDMRAQTKVFDSQGNEHTAVTYFVRDRSAGLTNIEWKFKNALHPNVNTFSENSPNEQAIYRNTFNSVHDGPDSRGVIAFDINNGNILDSSSVNSDSRYSSSSSLSFIPQNASLEAATSSISIDFSRLTSYNGKSTVEGNNLDGYATGNLIRLATEESTGNIKGFYSNGQSRLLVKLGLMSIDNPEGLQKLGTSYFVQTVNSNTGLTIKGVDDIYPVDRIEGLSSDSIDSKVHGSSLEASNVDVTEELTEMIITQRSYSGSGKVITTLDDMLQEALGLKR